MRARILAVDDEPDLLELVRMSLSNAGYEVETAASGSAALERLRAAPPDLILLDVMLPDFTGTELCKRIRADARLGELPLIMLTAKGEEVDRVVGFELGADDYVTKPFSPRELALRVRAVLGRRRPEGPSGALLTHGALRVDPERYRCWVGDDEIVLTAKEFQLLVALMRRRGRVYSREQLLDDVWGSDITVTARTIDTHLKRLREKLGAAGALIETVRGVGYRFAD